MPPTTTLITPWIDPANTFRAITSDQVFDVFISSPTLSFQHNVGEDISIIPFKIYLRNKSLSSDLSVTVQIPEFLTVNVNTFQVPRNSISQTDIVAKADFIIDRSRVLITPISSEIKITARPINFSGPVFVRTDLKALSESI